MSSPKDVFQEWSKRRNGILRALTTDVNKFYELCDPSRENLCLYGLDDSSWTVDLPVNDVPPELPEPVIGINFARDETEKKDWLAMIAAHSDSWLLAVAFFKATFFTKGERNQLLTMVNEQPTLFELLQKRAHDDNGVNRFAWPRGIEENEQSRKRSQFHPEEDHHDLPSGETVSDGDRKDGDRDPCPMCSRRYRQGEFGILCDLCDTWFCGRCAKNTGGKVNAFGKLPQPPSAVSTAPGGRATASPYARKLAMESGVSLEGVTGSGPGGRIVAADIAQLITSGKAAQISKGEPFTDIPHTQIRRITAKRLCESKQTVPHYYLTMECNMDRIQKEVNEAMEARGVGVELSVNDFIIKAAALALKDVPEVNSSWHDDFMRQYNTVDVSIAVQTPTGLMVPIVRNADEKGLEDICMDVRSLAKKAKEGRLTPEEFTGGTFTISNLGMFGIREFCAIVNPPQACILAVGAALPKIVQQNGVFKETSSMMVTMSCDHRVVDEAVGAQWLNAFKGYIEKPITMLM